MKVKLFTINWAICRSFFVGFTGQIINYKKWYNYSSNVIIVMILSFARYFATKNVELSQIVAALPRDGVKMANVWRRNWSEEMQYFILSLTLCLQLTKTVLI